MGNDHGVFYLGGWGDGIDRRGWKEVSDSARQNLESAKDEARNFVKNASFRNIDDESFKYTKKQAIKLHLVGKLRPDFNRWAKSFGAKPKWIQLTAAQKRQHSKYKHRKSAIYFSDLTIDKTVRHKLYELEPDTFSNELLLTEIALFTRLIHIGVPEQCALGWIVDIPKSQKKEKIPKIQDLTQFLENKTKELCSNTFYVENTAEYKAFAANTKKKKKTSTKRKQKRTPKQYKYGLSTTNNKNTLRPITRSSSSTSRASSSSVSNATLSRKTPTRKSNVKRTGFFAKKRKRSYEDDDDEWLPSSSPKKKRRTN